MRRELFPTIIGGGLPKEGIGVKSKRLSGYDFFVADVDGSHVYVWLNFPTKDGIDKLIHALEQTKALWEKEEN